MKKLFAIVPFVLVLAFLAAGCGWFDKDTSAKSDETVCVFDGSERGSQKLKYQILPGQEPKKSDGNDEVVRIPTSFRFYAAFEDRSKADAGAPESYLGYTAGNTPVQVQGQYRFKFNVDNACDWYAKHGRRNANDGNLGFNARSSESASALSPWVKWLNENFGTVSSQTIKAASGNYTWPELVYGNDPESKTVRNEPVDVAYGKHIGLVFTARLNKSLGGQFFCGTDVSIWDGDSIDPNCPPIFFETGPIATDDRELMAAREKTEALRAELANAEVEAKIRKANAAAEAKINADSAVTTKKAEKVAQAVLREQIRTAKLKAQAKVEVQQCIIYAKLGLDCDGRRPTIVYNGQSVQGN